MSDETVPVPMRAVRRLRETLTRLDGRDAELMREHKLLRDSVQKMDDDSELNFGKSKALQVNLEASSKRVSTNATEASHLRTTLRALNLLEPQ